MSDQVDYEAIRAESASEWAKMQVQKENSRRLARYDEAIRLLRAISGRAVHWEPLTPRDISDVNRFLAAEPKKGKRMVFEEITPAEANQRYRASMKVEPKEGR